MLVIIVPLAIVATIALVHGGILLHERYGETIRLKIERAKLRNKIPHATIQQPLSLVYKREVGLQLAIKSFDGIDRSREEDYKAALVQLHAAQTAYLELLELICVDSALERAPRSYRRKFSERLQAELGVGYNELLLFAALVLSRGGAIRGHPSASQDMREDATALCDKFDSLRLCLIEQCLKDHTRYPDYLRGLLRAFDKQWMQWEFLYCRQLLPESVSVPSTNGQHVELENLSVLLSEGMTLALSHGIVTQDDIDELEPSLMFIVPRLALMQGLYYTDSIDTRQGQLNDPHETQSIIMQERQRDLAKLKAALRTLTALQALALERMLACTASEPPSEASAASSAAASSAAASSTDASSADKASGAADPQLLEKFKQVSRIADSLHCGETSRLMRQVLRTVCYMYQTPSNDPGSPRAAPTNAASTAHEVSIRLPGSSSRGQRGTPPPTVRARPPVCISEESQAILRTGAIFRKMGRRGQPHRRFVWLTENLNEIMWCDPKSSSVRRGREHVFINEILDVVEGSSGSEVARAHVKVVADDKALSLVLKSRSLDLEATDKAQREQWIWAMRELVQAHNAALGDPPPY